MSHRIGAEKADEGNAEMNELTLYISCGLLISAVAWIAGILRGMRFVKCWRNYYYFFVCLVLALNSTLLLLSDHGRGLVNTTLGVMAIAFLLIAAITTLVSEIKAKAHGQPQHDPKP